MPSLRSLARWTSLVCALGTTLLAPVLAQRAGTPRVLVYTRNYTPDGRGYVHENIAESITAFRRICAGHGIIMDTSDDPAVFTPANLARYEALIFSNSNNEAFATNAQRDAFRSYIHAGHGFLAVHSASGSERNWPYFQQVLGGLFAFHPPQQTFTVRVADTAFTAVSTLPVSFAWNDECYFLDSLAPDLHIVLTTAKNKLDLDGKDATAYPDAVPLAWYHTFDNSREFYIALGHNRTDYSNPLFTGILERALLWCVQAQA